MNIDKEKEILLKLLLESDTATQSGDSQLASIGADPTTVVFNPGDLPAVQTHYETLLKRRLRQEIAHHPPLFPWEKEVQHYPDVLKAESSQASIWLDHLKNLEIPANLSEELLSDLFNHCQQIGQQSMQVGRRLVSAVQHLFPTQGQSLDYIAGLVASPAYRSPQALALETVDYSRATTQQQIALSMLTAKGIFETLRLEVSAAKPIAHRLWLIASGTLVVEASYHQDQALPRLEVRVTLPEPGQVSLQQSHQTMTAQRPNPGALDLIINHPQEHSPCCLEVRLSQCPEDVLGFQIILL
ncbi:MAG: hypothetical protein LVS60_06915 [Nodosilinea sp. LVE1205-7]|jgi:hypothetical protein